MTAVVVLEKKKAKKAASKLKPIAVPYGDGETFSVSGDLPNLLLASAEELKRAHRASSDAAPVNYLAGQLATDVTENGDLLFELTVYARFALGFHPSKLGELQSKLNSSQHTALRKMALAGKSRTASVTGYRVPR